MEPPLSAAVGRYLNVPGRKDFQRPRGSTVASPPPRETLDPAAAVAADAGSTATARAGATAAGFTASTRACPAGDWVAGSGGASGEIEMPLPMASHSVCEEGSRVAAKAWPIVANASNTINIPSLHNAGMVANSGTPIAGAIE